MTPALPMAASRPRLRPVGTAEAPLVVQVAREVRAAEFVGAVLPPDVLASLLDLQIRAQHAQYVEAHPDAVDHLIELDGQVVGRCWLDASDLEHGIRVLDIAVLPSARRRRVARRVLTDLQAEAAQRGIGVRLAVWTENQAALALYTGLDFRLERQRGDGYLDLQWLPADSLCERPNDERSLHR